MTAPRSTFARLLARARGFCRDRAEVEDLLQDALLIALQANRSPRIRVIRQQRQAKTAISRTGMVGLVGPQPDLGERLS